MIKLDKHRYNKLAVHHFGATCSIRLNDGYIESVRSVYRGRGFAKGMMRSIINWAIKNQRPVWLRAGRSSDSSLTQDQTVRMYEHAGFRLRDKSRRWGCEMEFVP